MRSSVGLNERVDGARGRASEVAACSVAVIVGHIRQFLSPLSHRPGAPPPCRGWTCGSRGLAAATGLTPRLTSGPQTSAFSCLTLHRRTEGTTNSTTRADKAEEGRQLAEVVRSGPTVGQRDVMAGRHHHHEVGGDTPRPVCATGAPVGEVGDLDQHGCAHPRYVEADGGVGLRTLPSPGWSPTCLTVGRMSLTEVRGHDAGPLCASSTFHRVGSSYQATDGLSQLDGRRLHAGQHDRVVAQWRDERGVLHDVDVPGGVRPRPRCSCRSTAPWWRRASARDRRRPPAPPVESRP